MVFDKRIEMVGGIMQDTTRVVARNSVFRLVTFFVTLITTIVYVRYVIKYLGIQLYGLWGLASLIITSSNIINFGFAAALTKETAKIDGEGTSYWVLRTLIKGYDYLIIGIGVLLFPLIYIFRNTISYYIFGVKDIHAVTFSYLLTAMVPLTILYILALSRKSVVEGFQEIHYSSIVTLIGRLVNFGLSLSLILGGLGIWSLYFASFAENLMLFRIFSYRISRKLKSQSYFQNAKLYPKRVILKILIYSFNLQLSAIASMSLEFFYKIFISHRYGLDYVGYFQVVWRAQRMLYGIISSTMGPLFPASAFYIAKDDISRLRNLYKKSIRYIWLLVVGILLIFVLFSDEILRLWIGQTSEFQIFTFRMLCGGIIFSALSTPAFLFVMGSGKSLFIGLTNISSLIMSVIVALILNNILVKLSWVSIGISFALGEVAGFIVVLSGFAKIFRWSGIKLTISSLPSLRFVCLSLLLLVSVIAYKSFVSIARIIPEYIMLFAVSIAFFTILLMEVSNEIKSLIMSGFLNQETKKAQIDHEISVK